MSRADVGAAIILGGGAGSRLYPLTKQRAKPAVPIGGAYRLIDVPMSNCINSGISKIYILTQFNSTSLNRHLARCVQPSPQQDRIWVQEHSARCRTASCVHAEGLPQLTHLERRAMAVQDIQCGLWGAVWG